MILLGPELGDDVPELVEASDRPATGGDGVEAEGTPTKRRRRRRSASADKADDALPRRRQRRPRHLPERRRPRRHLLRRHLPRRHLPRRTRHVAAGGGRHRRNRPRSTSLTSLSQRPSRSSRSSSPPTAPSRRPTRRRQPRARAGCPADSVAPHCSAGMRRWPRRPRLRPSGARARPPRSRAPSSRPNRWLPSRPRRPRRRPKRRTRKAAPKPEAVVEAEPVAAVPAEEATPAPERRTRKAAPKPEAVVEAEPVAAVPAEEAKPAPKAAHAQGRPEGRRRLNELPLVCPFGAPGASRASLPARPGPDRSLRRCRRRPTTIAAEPAWVSAAAASPSPIGHATPGAAEPAVAIGVLGEVLLVVVLGVVERARGRSVVSAVAGRTRAGPDSVALRLGQPLLRDRRGVDPRAVLGAGVVALAHALGRVVGSQNAWSSDLVARCVQDRRRPGRPRRGRSSRSRPPRRSGWG